MSNGTSGVRIVWSQSVLRDARLHFKNLIPIDALDFHLDSIPSVGDGIHMKVEREPWDLKLVVTEVLHSVMPGTPTTDASHHIMISVAPIDDTA